MRPRKPGIQTRIWVPPNASCFKSLESLGDDTKAVRQRIALLLDLGIQYELMLINSSIEEWRSNLRQLPPINEVQQDSIAQATSQVQNFSLPPAFDIPEFNF